MLHKSRDTCQEAHLLGVLFSFLHYLPSDLITARPKLEEDVISDLQIIPLLEVIFALSARPVFILSQWPDVPDQPLVDFYQESLLLETPSLGGAHTCLESWVTEVRFPPFAS